MFDASALRTPRDLPTVRGSRRRPDHAKRPGLRTKRCISGPRSLSWNDDVPRRIIAIRTTGRRDRPADCTGERRGDHGERPRALRPPLRAQHRHHRAHRRRQDDDDRAGPVLHGRDPPDGGRRQGEHDDRLSRGGARAGDHDRRRGDHLPLEGCRGASHHHQHHRHARPRRLHRRGRALAPRARRRRRGVLGRRGGGGAERDRLAAGGQVPRAADLLHQQDGPHRRRVRAGLPGDRGTAARRPPDPGADPHRRRPGRHDGRIPGPDRPDHDARALLQDRGPRLVHHRDRDPRVGPRRGRALAREDAQLVVRQGRDVHRCLHGAPRGRRVADRADRGRASARDTDRPGPPDPLRFEPEVRGRAAAAGRGRRLPAHPARQAAGRRTPPQEGDRADPQAQPRRAILRPGVQDHQRRARRPVVRPGLLGTAQVGHACLQPRQGQEGGLLAAVPHPGRRSRAGPGGARRRHRRRRRAEGLRHRRHPLRRPAPDPAGTDRVPRDGHQHVDRAGELGRQGEAGRDAQLAGARTRPSPSGSTRRPARR